MPILYACMLNSKKMFVFESFYAGNQVSYKREVASRFNDYEYMALKQIPLNRDAQLNLFYQHRGNYVLVCVSENTDQTEMNNFLDHINMRLLEEQSRRQKSRLNSSDYEMNAEVFQETNAEEIYKKLGADISKFLTDWNRDPKNRSKAA